MKIFFKNMFYGSIIGVSILIPGLSGGTTAIILGIYHDILNAVDRLISNFKKNVMFILILALGAGIGFYLSSFPLKYILDNFEFEFSFFVVGVIIGSLPLFFPSGGKVKTHNYLFVLAGILVTLLADLMTTFDLNANAGIFSMAAVGILSAIALILPGISLTYILIAFGYYERLILAINSLDFIFLLKFGAIVILGIFMFTRLLTRAYKKYPVSVNMSILGMVAASIKQVFIRMPEANELLVCVLLLASGLFCSFFFCLYEKRAS